LWSGSRSSPSGPRRYRRGVVSPASELAFQGGEGIYEISCLERAVALPHGRLAQHSDVEGLPHGDVPRSDAAADHARGAMDVMIGAPGSALISRRGACRRQPAIGLGSADALLVGVRGGTRTIGAIGASSRSVSTNVADGALRRPAAARAVPRLRDIRGFSGTSGTGCAAPSVVTVDPRPTIEPSALVTITSVCALSETPDRFRRPAALADLCAAYPPSTCRTTAGLAPPAALTLPPHRLRTRTTPADLAGVRKVALSAAATPRP
jgi:hypothetical protein